MYCKSINMVKHHAKVTHKCDLVQCVVELGVRACAVR